MVAQMWVLDHLNRLSDLQALILYSSCAIHHKTIPLTCAGFIHVEICWKWIWVSQEVIRCTIVYGRAAVDNCSDWYTSWFAPSWFHHPHCCFRSKNDELWKVVCSIPSSVFPLSCGLQFVNTYMLFHVWYCISPCCIEHNCYWKMCCINANLLM